MRIGGKHELYANLLCELAMPLAEVEPVRLTVDLDRAAALARTQENPFEIDVAALALADEPAGRVGQYGKMGVVHRAQQPLGLLLARQAECRVHSADGEIEPP